MICLICRQAETAAGYISLPLVREEMSLVVNHVPAEICPSCGEGYLGEDVTMKLLQGAEAVFLSGSIENIYEFEELTLQL